MMEQDLRAANETAIQAGGGSFPAQITDLRAYRELLRILIRRLSGVLLLSGVMVFRRVDGKAAEIT